MTTMASDSARCSALAEIWHSKWRYAHLRNLLYVMVSSGLACGMLTPHVPLVHELSNAH